MLGHGRMPNGAPLMKNIIEADTVLNGNCERFASFVCTTSNVCHADLGSPIFNKNGLIGVVSQQYNVFCEEKLSNHVNLYTFRDWIYEHLS